MEEKYHTNVTSRKLADKLTIYLQGIIADFSIRFDLETPQSILTLSGNREVSTLVIQTLASHGVECQLVPV